MTTPKEKWVQKHFPKEKKQTGVAKEVKKHVEEIVIDVTTDKAVEALDNKINLLLKWLIEFIKKLIMKVKSNG